MPAIGVDRAPTPAQALASARQSAEAVCHLISILGIMPLDPPDAPRHEAWGMRPQHQPAGGVVRFQVRGYPPRIPSVIQAVHD